MQLEENMIIVTGLKLENTLWKMELPTQQSITPLRGGYSINESTARGFPLSLSHYSLVNQTVISA